MDEVTALKTGKRKFSDGIVEKFYLGHLLSQKKTEIFYCFIVAIVLSVVAQIWVPLLWWSGNNLHGNISSSLSGINDRRENNTMEKSPGQDYSFQYLGTVMTICGIGAFITLLMLYNKNIKHSALCPHVAVLIWTTVILVPIACRSDSLPLRVGLGWIMLEIFLIWVTLPVRFEVAVVYAISVGILHTGVVSWKGMGQPMFTRQLTTNAVLLVAANVLGVMAYYFHDRQQRQAFIDTRQSLEVKDAMESAAKEQKRLLYSVLPKHLAETMAKDMGAANDDGSGFKKIYMNRHEPVSILFADIVGFTAMSAAIGSASKLVVILNDLFSAFDDLAEQHNQVRIKILGDCYYCICGAPDDEPQHAVLCVHMGLAVVDAIKVFQKRTNSQVDMRVGIHTGSLLAGVMGQRQWQFDVYSKDVELANKMESSGTPGRVHISNKTLSFLNDEFEVEPGEGEAHEEKLRMAGIKTYFIKKVLKPFTNTNNEAANGAMNGNIDHHNESYADRLEAHMKSQEGAFVFSNQASTLTYQFKDKIKESEYALQHDPSSGPSIYGLSCSLVAILASSFFAISFNLIGFTLASFLAILITFIGTITVGGRLGRMNKRLIHNMFALVFILGITCANVSLMIPCFKAGMSVNSTEFKDRNDFNSKWANLGCYFPAYFPTFLTLSLLALSIMSSVSSWLKTFLSLCVLGFAGVIMNLDVLTLKKAFLFSEIFSFPNGFDLILESANSALFLAFLFFLLFFLNRQLEISSRSLFLQRYDVVSKREQAVQLRLNNEALMCNIMPQHVAEHFLDKSRDPDVLYSQTYEEAGVVFVSMPNFADFYTEDAVNNQGLECLRFLNEVISDYDALLDEPRFNDRIIKIKTIGSSYMAASGLNPSIQANPDDNMRERWRHLNLLVEFVLEMKKLLNRINEESYNQFVLRIGLNYGAVTAGVIGATKPAYDIWGNTVNVASRMESTGKYGKMQVTEDCYKILRVYGYKFEKRGYVAVKGKGELLTYYLIGGGGQELTDEELEALEKEENEAAIPNPEM